MGIDFILGIIIFVVVLLGELFGLRVYKHQLGTKLMVAFLAGFIIFILFTDKVPQPGQKIPIIITALLLIWANFFLIPGKSEQPEEDGEQKTEDGRQTNRT